MNNFLVKIVEVSYKNSKFNRLFLCGVHILDYGKSIKGFIRISPPKLNLEHPFFYLKVNRDIPDTLVCLQHWIDIVAEYNSDFVIICDNKHLELNILEKIHFNSNNVRFISSYSWPFKKIVKRQKIARKWRKAANAHLTVFLHAQKYAVKKYWNIDADDSLILQPKNKVCHILQQAEKFAEENSCDGLAFDFWVTKCKGRHWSLGIVYFRNTSQIFKLLNDSLIDWKDYTNFTSVHNIDWVLTSLKDKNLLKLCSFYVENLYFIHFGRFLGDMKNSYLACWKEGYMSYPIWNIFKDKRGAHKIPEIDDLLKFECNVTEESCLDFAMEYLVGWKRDRI